MIRQRILTSGTQINDISIIGGELKENTEIRVMSSEFSGMRPQTVISQRELQRESLALAKAGAE
jgi:hypothetical protein